MTSRREALRTLSGLVAAPALLGLAQKGRVIGGGFADDDSRAGHALRDGALALASNRPERRVSVVIAGGGMGGLSAGWRLDALGHTDWTLLELSSRTGGNARSASYPGLQGQRAPWGAHYVPVPSHNAVHVRQLFRELGVLHANGEWDERVLCHSPQERIWQHGRWHEGLDPLDAATVQEREQFARFHDVISGWRETGMFQVPSFMGHDARRSALRGGGSPAARARDVLALDTMTAREWMISQRFTAPALRWWVEYGTRDDYGASLSQASAWAAVHYFAGRESEDEGPLTWPEGNDFIARELTRRLSRTRDARGQERLRTDAPVVHIARRGTQWVVDTPRERVIADAVIWSAPLFLLPRVCPGVTLPITLEYAPWVVANLVLDGLPQERGAPLAWDNVIYGSPSLGYVNAQHQQLGTSSREHIWTWYYAVVDRPAVEARRWLQAQPWTHWRDTIVADLQRAHPDIAQRLLRVDVMRWGHAMARPVPGTLDRVARLQQWAPAERLFVAHADLSNLSLFEEAQWHGGQAADRVVQIVG
ncbi:NAD(P)-binding protein [Gemmatimonas phototrophica]|uniref:NAD(P)-binding protein n=1 Tax=Gemmatimonas phototrophica TaxID=1379270 RepID=UPI0006A6E69F|nr:NAD(P)-binding protein [Gemmatimonas phototrophica]